jgi:Fe-S-cluster-containing dehydrogenase component/DMSO reductase anchor subunit
MRKGFIFDHTKCVNCNACSASCILENGWKVHPRNIYSNNSEAEYILPVINLSLACNHCETAICMNGCPTSAYSRDSVTGAIILDENKCIGCKYCQWNCPYDAPKYNIEKRTIAKCNLCYTGLSDGRQPACSSACPTGALRFDQLSEPDPGSRYLWFPDKNLNPSIEFTAVDNESPLRIIPGNRLSGVDIKQDIQRKDISDEISLIIFSFLATISVAILIISFVKGVYPLNSIYIPVLLLPGFVSLFHLGKKLRSWRSVMNLRNSPLSREIASYLGYTLVAFAMLLIRTPGLLIASLITGLTFLVFIDSVYYYSDRRQSVILHSGQTFITALLIGSFLSGMVLPFVFIAVVKLGISIFRLYSRNFKKIYFEIRFMRIAFLSVSCISIISHISYPELPVILIFIIGELLDRIIFYIDFDPMNINNMINEQLNIVRDEKKRG